MNKMDREKVIKALECCLNENVCPQNKCVDCPYKETDIEESCIDKLQRDSLDLLKQKPETCKNCSYHRHDGWCEELHRETGDNDYCSFGAWEGR